MNDGEIPPRCCIPCGKVGMPEKTALTTGGRKKKLSPMLEMLETDRKMSIKTYMENHAEIRRASDFTKICINAHMEQNALDLEKRGERLKGMMEDENYAFETQLKDSFEKRKESQIDDMRRRVTTLRQQREAHQKEIVEHKLNQCFQNQCEQMRTLLSKRLNKEIVQDWGEQLCMKKRLEAEKIEEERMWAYLWEQDAEEKWKREEAYNEVRKEASQRGLEELNKQMEYKRAKQADIDKIKGKERAMFEEIQRQIDEENRKREEEKTARFVKAKEHVKDMMATRDYYRDRRVKREELVAQEFLKKAIRELYIEQEDRNKKKKELMRAIEIYRDYIQKWDCLANSRELKLQRIIDEVIEEQYHKNNATRRKEQAQRLQLQKNVFAGRALQVEDLKAKREREEMERQEEIAHLKEDWRQYLEELDNDKAVSSQKKAQYRCDLDSQTNYSHLVKCREREEVKREVDMCITEDGLFLNRLQKTLKEPKLEMSNPYREPFVGKDVKQCFHRLG